MWKIISFLLSLIGHKVTSGCLFLIPSGPRTIKIEPGFTPKEVWIRPMQHHGVPVCQGDVDSFDTKIVPHGFILVANLTSEFREVQWIAIK